ncbi:hypothetical protein BP6252_07959 [Coleophoma cylindrospora]|uniref:AB hydrolase-1 domain-containing protein n=1 Tax=Coleophoma cylindrospora TaxID=1849047 RepID=A0A3D8RBQ3_9HELO|nr:hypothetical protein BP6252_07959 [Coleophoma cylindrospora]
MVSIKKAYYDTPDGQIHYRYLHSSSPEKAQQDPILLLHMSAASSLYFEPLMHRLAALGYDSYAPDMPGFGQSYDPEGQPANTRFYVEAFMLLATQHGWKHFHLLGHHTGASLGIEMAATYPAQVRSLCIIGAALLFAPEQKAMADALVIAPETYPVRDGAHLLKKWNRLLAYPGFEIDVLHAQVLDQIRAWQGRRQVYTCNFAQDIMGFLGRVKCAVLAMSARESMLFEYMGRVRDVKPDAKCVTVGGGEFEVLLDVDGVYEAYKDFLDSAPHVQI